MGTLTGLVIANRAWTLVNDTVVSNSGTRWKAAEATLWLSDAQREVVMLLPSAYTRRAVPTTQAGTRQTFAGLSIADGLQPLRIPRNFSADGTTPGRAITPRPMAWIDDQRPTWHSDAPAVAEHWFYDPADPKAFYLWPPAPGNTKIELVYSALPADLANLSATIVLDDEYANAMGYYLLFRFFSKGAAYSKNPALANGYYQLFAQVLGVRLTGLQANNATRQLAADGSGVAAAGA